MSCTLSLIIIGLLMMNPYIICEPPGFAAYMGVDFQDGGFGKYIFIEIDLHRPTAPPYRVKKPNLYNCRSSGMFPDPIDPGSYYKCTFSFSDGYTFTRYFCPPFYTFSAETKSCVIYYDDFPNGNGANETSLETAANDFNITSTARPSVISDSTALLNSP